MYESEFGTDWRTLGPREAIERAYALGVAASLEEAPDGELDRLVDEAGSTYDRSLVQLAYDEGRTRGLKYAEDASDEEVWSDLAGDGEVDVTAAPVRDEVPSALGRMRMLDPPGDDLDRLRLPPFLRRER